jgi:GTP cyclohydrolase II
LQTSKRTEYFQDAEGNIPASVSSTDEIFDFLTGNVRLLFSELAAHVQIRLVHEQILVLKKEDCKHKLEQQLKRIRQAHGPSAVTVRSEGAVESAVNDDNLHQVVAAIVDNSHQESVVVVSSSNSTGTSEAF